MTRQPVPATPNPTFTHRAINFAGHNRSRIKLCFRRA